MFGLLIHEEPELYSCINSSVSWILVELPIIGHAIVDNAEYIISLYMPIIKIMLKRGCRLFLLPKVPLWPCALFCTSVHPYVVWTYDLYLIRD